MLLIVACLLVVPAVAPAAGTTTERDRLQCLGTVRRDLGLCMKAARERCQAEFRGRLPDCLGGAECPTACTDALDRCEEPLLADRDGCRLACQGDQKAAIQGCRLADDKPACRSAVRTKAVKCKARCTRTADRPLRACRTVFGECLRACARGE